MSPTARTLKKLREEGWLVQVVEKYNWHANVRQDLFGIIDILAVRGKETLGVQCTSGSNLQSRVKKLTDSDALSRLRDAGWRIECHGWRKLKTGWQEKVVDLS